MNRNVSTVSPVAGIGAALPEPTGDQLVAELCQLGLRYLSGATPHDLEIRMTPAALLEGLATSMEARLRAALVPLFIWRPDLAPTAPLVASQLPERARLVLECSYSAAVALQRQQSAQLARLGCPVDVLTDYFAEVLGPTDTDNPMARLAEVAERHAQRSGEHINWLGTYIHSVDTFLRFA